MPLDYRIDQELRVVFATANRVLSDEELFSYHDEVWSRGGLNGYDEVVDLSLVEMIAPTSSERVRDLADLASATDAPGSPSRLAIVAPHDLVYGFARMFEAYRTMNQRSTRAVSVFRSMPAALDWLGVEAPREPSGGRRS